MLARSAVALCGGAGQPDMSLQHLQRRFAGTLVIGEARSRGQGYQRLAQCVVVPAVKGVRTAAATGVVRCCQLCAREDDQ